MLESLLLALFPSVPAAPPRAEPPAALQDDDKPDKRPEIAELLERLKKHVAENGQEDQLAVEVIDQLATEFPKCGEKDRAAIVKGVDACFKEKRKPTDEGAPDNLLHLAAATALGEMGPESAKPLAGWIDHKSLRKDLNLQRAIILALGKTKAESGIEPLVDLLDHHQATMQAAGAEALGNYDKEDQEVRKEIFEAILKVLTALKNNVDADVNDVISRERYEAISAAMIGTLQKMSGHDARDPSDWTHWWNKNKKEDWDAGKG